MRTLTRMLATICALCAMSGVLAWAQTADTSANGVSDTDIQLLRSDLQADKNKVIADTMQFTDAESTAFWPVYRNYSNDQQKIGDQRVQLIKDYVQDYNNMDNPMANNMAKQMFSIDDKTLHLREAYWPKFVKALGAKRAAKFYQVDNRLSLIVNVQLSSNIPLIP